MVRISSGRKMWPALRMVLKKVCQLHTTVSRSFLYSSDRSGQALTVGPWRQPFNSTGAKSSGPTRPAVNSSGGQLIRFNSSDQLVRFNASGFNSSGKLQTRHSRPSTVSIIMVEGLGLASCRL